MTGTDKIKEKILEDARHRARSIEEQAHEESQRLLDDAKREAAQKKIAMLKKAESDGAESYRRLMAISGLEGRKEVLRAKQDMVDAAFHNAMEQIIQLPDGDYQKLLEGMVILSTTKGKGEILLSEKDLRRMDHQFIKNVNQGLSKAGINGNLTLSEETIETAGGFVLKCGDMEINNTFEILFSMLRPELENDVVKILFSA